MIAPVQPTTEEAGVEADLAGELKYLKRDDDKAQADAALAQAKSQLKRYLADENLAQQRRDTAYTGLAVVFRGWELARYEAVA